MIILLAIGVVVVLCLALIAWQYRRDSRKSVTDWDWYSIPTGTHYVDWEVGVRHTTRTHTEKHVVREWKGEHPSSAERLQAEGEAIALATEFNSSREYRA